MVRAILVAAALAVAGAAPAYAHLMENQQGTLNLVDSRGYLVLSLPVSALTGVDDDGDGRLSAAELQRHSVSIERDLRSRIRVADRGVAAPLEGVLLNLSPDDQHREGGPATHLVMLAVAMFRQPPQRPELGVRVFGRRSEERAFRVVVTQRDSAVGPRKETARLTASRPQHEFFALRAPTARTK